MENELTIYIDLNNYLAHFINSEGPIYNPTAQENWDLSIIQQTINNIKNRGFPCKNVFLLDVVRVNEEEQEKWKSRREREFLQENKGLPVCFNHIIAKCLEKNGFEVGYSPDIDCDDLLANLAFYNYGAVMSRDNDMLRYIGFDGQYQYDFFQEYQPFKIIKEFYPQYYQVQPQVNKKLFFTKQDYHQREIRFSVAAKDKGESQYEIKRVPTRKISKNQLKFTTFKQYDPNNYQMKNINPLQFGVGSSLCKQFGNIYKHLQELRQALYYEIGMKKVKIEEIIEPNEKKDNFIWKTYKIEPKCNSNILKYFLKYIIDKNLFVKIPQGVSELQYYKIQQYNVDLYITGLMYHCQATRKSIADEEFSILKIKIPKFEQKCNYENQSPLQPLNLSQELFEKLTGTQLLQK
ncbi:hypothetical protein PPERSA_01328 [Pseudocohnilembus persalinus]|uniref:PIN domain-like protein n=1 Tax=Pseudocohnilembus persalinus TaxID=266149 RepID=A0A0V0QGL2_PSEPJ|nr:hypothetical protein PPERSA_01328 [Pseudocohnilembus persalinus]|eukprot:KRX01425.1 hypothetical protein PPERSA_01328 [Pseudocohnilembus persalinus]